jgi:hypothetical protein
MAGERAFLTTVSLTKMQTLVQVLSKYVSQSLLTACPKIARIDSINASWGLQQLNEGNTLMTHKTYIAMATSIALALGSFAPAFAEDAPETATEAPAQPAGDAPDKSAEASEDNG